MDRIFSGIQPSGNLQLGNYLGAIRNWARMQQEYECIFCVVDLHAITLPQNPRIMREATREVAAGVIAGGVDPKNCIIFNQSQVPEHSELAWIFNCVARLGWLNRMTQFKEKAGKDRDGAFVGLYTYPVLQAADILAYKATDVPVGEDQKQHIEMARDMAGRFNRYYDCEALVLPEPHILEDTATVPGTDGRKMSKSYGNHLWIFEEGKKLKQKGKDATTAKMGKIDIDYQVLHDAFFKFQTKPKMTAVGEVYYEGKEYETPVEGKRPGWLSEETREALGVAEDGPPPWLINMQRYGPPPSYPHLKIPGVSAPIPAGAPSPPSAG